MASARVVSPSLTGSQRVPSVDFCADTYDNGNRKKNGNNLLASPRELAEKVLQSGGENLKMLKKSQPSTSSCCAARSSEGPLPCGIEAVGAALLE